MKKPRNKKAIIITGIVMLIGILLVLAGFFGGTVLGLFNSSFDADNINPEDIGKTFRTDILVYYETNIDNESKALQVMGRLDGEGSELLLDFSELSDKEINLYYSKSLQHVTIEGTLRAMSDEEFQEIAGQLADSYDYIYYNKKSEGEWQNVTLDMFHQRLVETVRPYCINVTSITSFNWIPFIPAGIIIFLLSLVVEICFVFRLKKKIVLPVVYGLMIIVPSVMFFGHIRTILSVKKVSDGLYTIKNIECTDTKDLLASDSGSVSELMSWIFDNHLYGIDLGINDDSFRIGCASFAALSPDNDHLFGRNFDYPETDTLLVYSHPEGAYESIGVADIGIFRVGQTYPISPDSPLGRFVMVVTPYFVVDGMNEKGVGAGILELVVDETHQDNGKPDLLIYAAIRGILDTCASVDEALAFLESYDIHSGLGVDYHLFITDRSGRYVVVEWIENQMVVTEHPCCTNSIITLGEFYNKGNPDGRLATIETELGSDRIVTEQEAMDILHKVNGNGLSATEWSCVYNLDDLTVNICLDCDYSTTYTFSLSDFS